jgi:O-acetylserine/cysteine efflux transporter
MNTRNRTAIFALVAAGTLWGLTVPLSKLALGWLSPGWLTVARFVLAAPGLAVLGRGGLRDACTPGVIAAGAFGFGGVVLLQNAGIAHTSVSHAAVLLGAVPVLVALFAVGAVRTRSGSDHVTPSGKAWGGYALALVGVAFVAGGNGGGSTMLGDALVLASTVLSAAFIMVQPRLLAGRDAAAVTAVQVAAGTLLAAPIAVLTGPAPHAPASAVPVLALAVLAIAGTLMPFLLFAYGQSHVPASLAGAFVNIEPVVGAAIGWLAFGNPASAGQLAGAAAVIAGIAVSTLTPRTAAAAAPAPDERLNDPGGGCSLQSNVRPGARGILVATRAVARARADRAHARVRAAVRIHRPRDHTQMVGPRRARQRRREPAAELDCVPIEHAMHGA